MGYLTLLKLVFFVIIASSIAVGSFGIGRKIEKSEWQDRELKRQVKEQEIERAKAKEFRDAMQRVADQKEKEQDSLIGALNEREREIHRLNNDIADTKRLRFKTSRTACDQPALPTKAKDSGLSDGKIEIELPAAIESGIRSIVRDAERELIDCNALRDTIRGSVDIIN